ncbi:MAG: hypothetical protein ACPF8V_10940, partial [Luteibaculum sp.]
MKKLLSVVAISAMMLFVAVPSAGFAQDADTTTELAGMNESQDSASAAMMEEEAPSNEAPVENTDEKVEEAAQKT